MTRLPTGWIAALGLLAVTSCAPDSPVILLAIESDLAVPDQVDELLVTLVASRAGERDLCAPAEVSIGLPSGAEPAAAPGFEVRVAVEAGEVFTEWLAFRVAALSAGQEVQRLEGRVPWPESGSRQLRVELATECHEVLCGLDEHCLEGRCVGVAEPGAFDGAEGGESPGAASCISSVDE